MKRHAFDVTAFVWGVLFLLGAGAVLLDEYGSLELDVRWLLPAGLIAAGIAGIANAVRSHKD